MESEMNSSDIRDILAAFGGVAAIAWLAFITISSIGVWECDGRNGSHQDWVRGEIKKLWENDDIDTEDIESLEKRMDAIEKKLGTHGGE
jgi:hypothetical protein